MKEILEQLIARKDLSGQQMKTVFDQLMTGQLDDTFISAFLIALECKGITSEELGAAALVMREKSIRVPITVDAVDTCGTGGDGVCTFNVSSSAGIIAAGAGAYVAKHGNRTNTRRSGSAEAFAALGVNIDADVEIIARCIHETHIGFCYAVKLHPAMKYAAPIRKSLGVRTLFNILGPMTNPARVKRQIIGVSREHLGEKLAGAMTYLDTTHAMIIHGCEGLCDISINGPTKIWEVKGKEITRMTVRPEDFGLTPVSLDGIMVSSPQESAEVIRSVLSGKMGPARDIATLNAGAALVVAGLAPTLDCGLAMARESIDSGAAAKTLQRLIDISQGK
jgi:anthranilate phosphoribosyltransferase